MQLASRQDEKRANQGAKVYRQAIRLTASQSNVVTNEFRTVKVGDFVAIRSTRELLVPALPDECK